MVYQYVGVLRCWQHGLRSSGVAEGVISSAPQDAAAVRIIASSPNNSLGIMYVDIILRQTDGDMPVFP